LSNNILIRTIKQSDIPAILELYNDGFEDWVVSKYSKFEPLKFKKTILQAYNQMMTNNLTQIYVGEKDKECIGILVCDVESFPMSSQLYGMVDLIHINKKFRQSTLFLKFIRKAEQWSTDCGFSQMLWGFNESEQVEKLKSVFNKKGYRPYEYFYIKTL
jgi:hypothetical protein